MEEQEETATSGIKRASLLGLPAELRIPVYRELFRVKSWEAHRARAKDVSAPKRILSDQCPVCQCVRNDRDYAYPACRLVLTDGEPALAPPCYTPSGPDERRNRCAILRTCRTTFAEAESILYGDTPFVVALKKADYAKYGLAFVETSEPERKLHMPLSKVQVLHMRVDTATPSAELGRHTHMSDGDLIPEIMNSVWHGREQTKLHIKLWNTEDGIYPRILLATKDDESSHVPLRAVFYGVPTRMTRELWYSFVLLNALPNSILNEVASFVSVEDRVDGCLRPLEVLLEAGRTAKENIERYLRRVSKIEADREVNDRRIES